MDNGLTWTNPLPFSINATSGAANPRIATDRAGHWTVIWEVEFPVEIDEDTEYYFGDEDSNIILSTFVLGPFPPTARSITPSPAGPTNATRIDFTVTFSENVIGFDTAGDLIITHDGTTHDGLTITGGARIYNVSLTKIAGDGNLSLRVDTESDAHDVDGNTLTESATANIAIDNTPPEADAGFHQAIAVHNTITLDGSGSSDTRSDALTFAWYFSGRPSESTTLLFGATTDSP